MLADNIGLYMWIWDMKWLIDKSDLACIGSKFDIS